MFCAVFFVKRVGVLCPLGSCVLGLTGDIMRVFTCVCVLLFSFDRQIRGYMSINCISFYMLSRPCLFITMSVKVTSDMV